MDLINFVEVANTGKFNYHLKILGDLIEKDAAGKYALTEKGKLAADFLQKFPEKKVPPTRLGMVDAALIGLAGFGLVAVNPFLLVGLLLDANNGTVPALALPLFPLGALLYGLLVPSVVMWFLSVRRAHSHELYDLFRPSLAALVPLLVFTILMIYTKTPIAAEIKAPLIEISGNATRQIGTMMSMFSNFLQGIFFSFLGVAIIEGARRIRRRQQ
jgi:hypothetical protein